MPENANSTDASNADFGSDLEALAEADSAAAPALAEPLADRMATALDAIGDAGPTAADRSEAQREGGAPEE